MFPSCSQRSNSSNRLHCVAREKTIISSLSTSSTYMLCPCLEEEGKVHGTLHRGGEGGFGGGGGVLFSGGRSNAGECSLAGKAGSTQTAAWSRGVRAYSLQWKFVPKTKTAHHRTQLIMDFGSAESAPCALADNAEFTWFEQHYQLIRQLSMPAQHASSACCTHSRQKNEHLQQATLSISPAC